MLLIQILTHTPTWVFGLFAVLAWYGAKQLRPGNPSLARVALMPLIMVGLAIFGVASAFGGTPLALAGWAAAAITVFALIQRRPVPAGARYDTATRSFHVPGSAVPLVLMMSIFLTKYVVGVALAMHPELRHESVFAIGLPMLYGAFSGAFAGRAVRLWKLALRRDDRFATA